MKSRVMALADLESGDSYFVVDNPLPVVTSRGRKKGKKGRRALGSFFHMYHLLILLMKHS